MGINYKRRRLSELSGLVIHSLFHLFFKYLLLPLTIVFLLYALLLHAAPPAPDKTLTIVNQESESPLWKKWWDEARTLAQQQNFEQAIAKYHEVLDEKPHIEEVKWELSKSYIAAEEYGQALVILESLIETSPEKIDYLASGAEVALAMGKADLASKLFGRALALDPGGPGSEKAMLGLVQAFTEQGKKQLTIPLMEQLYQRGVMEPEMIHELARHYAQQQNYVRAAHYYLELVDKFEPEPSVRVDAADVFDKSDNTAEAAAQRELYLQIDPQDKEERIKLADYYYDQGEMRKALPHMLELIDKQVRRDDYLLAVARIYLYSLGRTDRALQYFEQYRKEYPGGHDVSSEISTLQLIVANDLLAIVENDGVWMLWRDLARVTPDRIGIYRAMADMLEEMGREREKDLLEVLQIINIHEPKDFETVTKTSVLFMKYKRYDDCLAFLDNTKEHHLNNTKFLLLQARCEDGSGLDLMRLQTYGEYLKIRPDDQKVLRKAIELAGSLGLVDEMRSLYTDKGKKSPAHGLATMESYFKGLLDNDLLEEAQRVYQPMVDQQIAPEMAMRLARDLSTAYLQKNRLFVAEQVLRAFAARYPDSAYGYLLLGRYHILRNDFNQAEVWLGALDRQVQSTKIDLDVSQKSINFYLNLQLDQLLGKVGTHQKALSWLNRQMRSNKIVAEDVEILLFAVQQYLLTNRYDESLKLMRRFQPKFKGEDRLGSLRHIVLHEKNKTTQTFVPEDLGGLSYSEGVALAESLLGLGRSDEAYILLEELTSELPESLRAQTLLARSAKAAENYREALRLYRTLADTLSEEAHFKDQVIRLENLIGQPESIFSVFSVAADDTGRKNRIAHTIDSMDYPEAKLMWARALWAQDKWEESLDVYGLLDTELKRNVDQLIDLLQGRPEISSQNFVYQSEKKISDLDELESVDLLMSTDFIAANLEQEINRISSEYYNYYRWGKIVGKEMTAKSSLKAREFYQAEIDYRNLLEEDDELTEPVYPDLATVYGRLGRYKQEGEVLETIKERSIYYPDLSRVSEKSIRRRRPFLSLDGSYKREEGRDGFKNITQKYLGVGFEIKPTLSQEVGVRAGRNEYGNSFSSTLAKSNYLLGNYAIQVGDTTEGGIKLGFEDFDTDGNSFLIYDVKLKTSLEQRVELFGAVTQYPVDDTIESLEDNIYRKDVKIGFNLDYLFGLFFGFDLSFYDYNDSNEGERYYLWGAYRWFGERSFVDFTYSYLKLQNEISNQSSADLGNDDGLSYWSPGDYWKHRLAGLYKLELWPTGRLQSGTSSFSAMYAIGYEKDDVLVHEFDANILLEISQPFLVKGGFSTLISDDYDNLKGYISLIYRW